MGISETNVLSIDFTYFQKTSKELINQCYPDGKDREIDEAMLAWGEVLSDEEKKKKIESVQINIKELYILQEILPEQKNNARVMLCNSHVNIYDFIKKNASKNKKLNIVNVDMYHDLYNKNKQLDCGNWMQFIKKEYSKNGCNLNWIANPISASIYNMDAESSNRIPTTLNAIYGKNYDLIFLCRSDIWTPPHLDEYFKRLVNTLKGSFNSIMIEQGIEMCRSVDNILQAISEIKKEEANINREAVQNQLENKMTAKFR